MDALTDEDIERAIAEDPDSAPPLDADWFRQAELVIPVAKIATSIRVDSDVMGWFKTQGRGWQTRMNAVLRAYAKAHGGVK
ncbi:BrnA antitoxin family protein [Phenylobacterium sp.]|uniref:BrnA antitoxin family protein n=1 Tax=Phenylobacterium sp. TaxID=1871053 RepID=UPI00286C18BA|nr:BrnA antitoxin family protein [Phenylobacterium sp.]